MSHVFVSAFLDDSKGTPLFDTALKSALKNFL